MILSGGSNCIRVTDLSRFFGFGRLITLFLGYLGYLCICDISPWQMLTDENDYDILLLDVEMGGMDGVTLAKKLRQGNETVQIVFITGYSDYIAEGYEVAALHYLMKPVDEQKLFSVLDRAVEKLRKDEKTLTVESGGATVRIPVRQIPNAMYQGCLTTEKRADQQYEIEFRDVSFKYPGSDIWALRHVDLRFRIGSRLAMDIFSIVFQDF